MYRKVSSSAFSVAASGLPSIGARAGSESTGASALAGRMYAFGSLSANASRSGRMVSSVVPLPPWGLGGSAARYWKPIAKRGPSRRRPRWIASRSCVVLWVVNAHAYATSWSRTPAGNRPSTGDSSPFCAGWLMPGPGATMRVPQAVGEDDRVALLLAQRQHRAQDQGPRRALVEGQQLVGLVARVGVVAGRAGRREHVRARAAAGEEKVPMLREGIVGEVLARVGEDVRDAPRAQIEGPHRAVVDLHQVHAVVGRVGVVLPGEEVEHGVERDADRRVGAEPVELVEERARALLELRWRRQAGVQPQPRRAARIGARGEIVGEGDLRERLPRRLEDDARPAGVARGSEPFDRLRGTAAGERAQGEEEESPRHRPSFDDGE